MYVIVFNLNEFTIITQIHLTITGRLFVSAGHFFLSFKLIFLAFWKL